MVEAKQHTVENIRGILTSVLDPEIPVLNVLEMGIIRDIDVNSESVIVTITPTYSGCPAMHVIEEEIRSVLRENGIETVEIKTTFSPAWTTEWLSENTKLKLKDYGIAPPSGVHQTQLLQIELPPPPCPYCKSKETELKSQFGSTACKAYYFCPSCRQPFEYFKPI
ncbi:MAG: 1,2-phenylacetyl-CoA epoxidase subunit PaaD [Bacteroidota bacterium]